MKLLEKLKNRKSNNKGFSLVELIIVIAIMAILIGIVGTQVVPYIEKSKASKDLQVVSSYSTAATTAYSENADKITLGATAITIDIYGTAPTDAGQLAVYNTIRELTSTSMPSFGSKTYKDAKTIKVTLTSTTITAQAYNGTTPVGEKAESKIN